MSRRAGGLHVTACHVGGCDGEARELPIFVATLRRLGLPATFALLIALVVLPIAPISADDRSTRAIAGTVRTEGPGGTAGRPVGGVEVRLLFGDKSQTRTTDADGRYHFADLLPSKYTVKMATPAGFRVVGDATVGVTLDRKRDLTVDFKLVPVATSTPVLSMSPPGAAPQGAATPGTAPQGLLPGSILPPSVIARSSPAPVANASPAPRESTAGTDSALALTAPSAVVTPAPTPMLTPEGPGPSASPRAVPTLPSVDDVRANLPPRRLVTSFAALSESAREATIGQLRTYANETSLILGVPFRTQIDGTDFSLVNCGPASLAMVLAAYGIDVDPASVRDYLNYLVGNYDTEIGTSLEHLGRIAREAGLSTLGLYGRGGFRPWTVNDVREYVRAGYPVITLTKYRKLPGHLGSQTDFDHYVVITGLAGEDFVYNDAAYATEYGRNLLISPAELEQAWAASSIPRHAMAVGLGDSVRPLPIVPRRLQPEAMARVSRDPATAAESAERIESAEAAARAERPLGMVPGRATQNLRERLLDDLGARSLAVGEELANLHPSDIRPEISNLPNIRIPAEALPDAEAAPARLFVPRGLEETIGTMDEAIIGLPIGEGTDEALGIDAAASRAADAERAAGDADQEDWGRYGVPLTGLLGLILLAGGIAHRRRLTEKRRFAAERMASAPAAVDL